MKQILTGALCLWLLGACDEPVKQQNDNPNISKANTQQLGFDTSVNGTKQNLIDFEKGKSLIGELTLSPYEVKIVTSQKK